MFLPNFEGIPVFPQSFWMLCRNMTASAETNMAEIERVELVEATLIFENKLVSHQETSVRRSVAQGITEKKSWMPKAEHTK